jgi:FAD/FMN-containing dehydrogenase
MHAYVYRVLENIVGPENITDKDYDIEAYTRDLGAGDEKRASFVVRPKTNEQVSTIVHVANRYRIPIYVRGGGTTHHGAWQPIQGGILLDMTRMNRIIEIDEENLTATVEAGCTWYKLYKALKEVGLAHDPREQGGRVGTVGASIAKIGSGPIGVSKRGRLGWDVLGLEVVLPTGEITKTAAVEYMGTRPFENRGIGPDITHFFIGSMGELGIFTEVTLRVSPIPHDDYLYFNFTNYKDLEKAGDALSRPVGDELVFTLQHDVSAPWIRKGGTGIDVEAWICGYSMEELEFRRRKVREICVEAGGKEGDPDIAEKIFHRHEGYHWKGLPDYFTKGPVDYVSGYCPLYSLHEYYDLYNKIVIKKHRMEEEGKTGFGGWLIPRGWGIYVEFVYTDPEERPKILEIGDELTKKFCKIGFLPEQLGGHQGLHMARHSIPRLGPWYELTKRFKRMLDPNNILNPGLMIR